MSIENTIKTAKRIAKQIEGRVEEIEQLKNQLEAANKQIDLDVLLADLASHLREVPTRNMSEGQRLRHQGLRKRLNDVRAA
jgi:hypothetical protein